MNHQTSHVETIRTTAQVGAIASLFALYGWAQVPASEAAPLSDGGWLPDLAACGVSGGGSSLPAECLTQSTLVASNSLAQTLPPQWSPPVAAASPVVAVSPATISPATISPATISRPANSPVASPAIAPSPGVIFSDSKAKPITNRLPAEMERTYDNLLEQAHSAADQGQFVQALTQVAGVPRNSRHYTEAQRLQKDWSEEVVRQATDFYQQAKMDEAIALLETVPPDPTRPQRVVQLKQQWQQQSALLNRAIAARTNREWKVALSALQALEKTPLYHSPAVQDLLHQTMMECYQPDERLLRIAMEGVVQTAP